MKTLLIVLRVKHVGQAICR